MSFLKFDNRKRQAGKKYNDRPCGRGQRGNQKKVCSKRKADNGNLQKSTEDAGENQLLVCKQPNGKNGLFAAHLQGMNEL